MVLRRHVRCACHIGRPAIREGSSQMSALSILLLVLGAAIGGVCAAAYRRRQDERTREQLKAISLDVLAQTGESLAQRADEARRAEEERASGEMAMRAHELKGLVGPVAE